MAPVVDWPQGITRGLLPDYSPGALYGTGQGDFHHPALPRVRLAVALYASSALGYLLELG